MITYLPLNKAYHFLGDIGIAGGGVPLRFPLIIWEAISMMVKFGIPLFLENPPVQVKTVLVNIVYMYIYIYVVSYIIL